MGNNYFNSEGYPDPTAYHGEKAVRKADAELEKKANRAVGMIKLLLECCGFELMGRITLRDRSTGKEFK